MKEKGNEGERKKNNPNIFSELPLHNICSLDFDQIKTIEMNDK